jgi:hypothetical protein
LEIAMDDFQRYPDDFDEIISRSPKGQPEQEDGKARPISADDFFAYMPTRKYIFVPTGELWPGKSVNARLGFNASAWLDQNRRVEQMTWAPGQPMLIEGRLIADGGGLSSRAAESLIYIGRQISRLVIRQRSSHGSIICVSSILKMRIISFSGWHTECRNLATKSIMH